VAAELSAAERAVLLSLGAVGGERVGQSADGGGGVDARSVVNGLCKSELLVLGVLIWHGGRSSSGKSGRISRTGDGTLADEADEGSPNGVVESDGGTHFDVK
jgi:hypothetical protein